MKGAILKRVLILIFVNFGFSSSQLVKLDLPIVYQKYDSSCWAAVSKSVLQYYGTVKTEDSIIIYANNRLVLVAGGNPMCDSIGTAPNVQRSIKNILTHFANIYSSCIGDTITLEQVKNTIYLEKPIIIRWSYWKPPNSPATSEEGDFGHFIVLFGYNGQGIYYMDPWTGQEYWQGYKWIVYGDDDNYYHEWTTTLDIQTKPPFHNLNIGTATKNGLLLLMYSNLLDD